MIKESLTFLKIFLKTLDNSVRGISYFCNLQIIKLISNRFLEIVAHYIQVSIFPVVLIEIINREWGQATGDNQNAEFVNRGKHATWLKHNGTNKQTYYVQFCISKQILDEKNSFFRSMLKLLLSLNRLMIFLGFLLAFFILPDNASGKNEHPTSLSSIAGGSTCCAGSNVTLSIDITSSQTCNPGNQASDVTVYFYSNSTLSNTGGTLVFTDNPYTAGWPNPSTVTSTYSFTAVATLYYYVVVSYTATGCTAAGSLTTSTTQMALVTVEPIVSITGNNPICIGETTQLFPTSGGDWVSNNPTVASVVQRTGVVTALSAGSATFTFTADNPICSATTSALTVNLASTAPTVTSFSPASACAGSGASVVITGTNFTGATAVNFNGLSATSYSINSSTQITATLPAGATTGPISVTTPSGTGTSSSNFTVNSVPLAPSTTGALICVGSTAILSASGAISGQFYKWYDAASGGNLLKTSTSNTDNTYTTAVLNATTSYWVSILNAAGCESSRTQVTATFPAISPDDQNTAGTNSWIGHVYKDYVYGSHFTDYFGYYTESSSTFNQAFGGGTNCFTINSSLGSRQIYTDLFSVRLRMNYTSDKGLYVVNLGSDDGSRLTIDGTLVHNNWGTHGFTSIPNVLINLTSNSSLIYEYFENQGGNRITFQSLTLVLSNILSANTSQSICLGNSGAEISGDEYGTLPTNITLSGTGYQWVYSTSSSGPWNDISGATSATYTPSTTAAPFNSAGTYYVIRKAILSSTNNVSPNPYVATNESNYATLVVTSISAPVIGTITQPTCATATGTVALSGLPTTSWTVTASSGATITGSSSTANFSGLAANTTYTFTVTSLGCTSTSSSSAFINAQSAPTPLSLVGSSICPSPGNNGTITSAVSAVGVTYQLYNSSGTPQGVAQTGSGSGLMWSDLSAGSGYYVEGTDNISLCSSSSNSVDILTNSNPVGTPQNISICSEDFTNYTPVITPESTFTWTITGSVSGASDNTNPTNIINQQLSIPNNATSGSVVYVVTPTSTAGCVGAPFSITVTVEHPAIGSFE